MTRVMIVGSGGGIQTSIVRSILQRIGADQTQLIEPIEEVKTQMFEPISLYDPDDWVNFQWFIPHDPIEYEQFPLVLILALVYSAQTAWLWWFYTLW